MLTAVIGAVGPDIWVGASEKSCEKLIKIAPYKPALGPNPELKPNASASGKQLYHSYIKKSPLKFEKSNFNTFLNTTTKNINNFQLFF